MGAALSEPTGRPDRRSHAATLSDQKAGWPFRLEALQTRPAHAAQRESHVAWPDDKSEHTCVLRVAARPYTF